MPVDGDVQNSLSSGPAVISPSDEADAIETLKLEDEITNLYPLTADEQLLPQLEPENDDSIHWSSFACELGLQGLAQEIALNSTLE